MNKIKVAKRIEVAKKIIANYRSGRDKKVCDGVACRNCILASAECKILTNALLGYYNVLTEDRRDEIIYNRAKKILAELQKCPTCKGKGWGRIPQGLAERLFYLED